MKVRCQTVVNTFVISLMSLFLFIIMCVSLRYNVHLSYFPLMSLVPSARPRLSSTPGLGSAGEGFVKVMRVRATHHESHLPLRVVDRPPDGARGGGRDFYDPVDERRDWASEKYTPFDSRNRGKLLPLLRPGPSPLVIHPSRRDCERE